MVQKLLGGLAVLFAIIATELYFIHRYWWWLNSPSNVSGVQTATSIMLGGPTVIFAIFATLAAIESAQASSKQATAADKQAVAADRQATAADSGIRFARAQTVAAQVSVRPVLIPVLNITGSGFIQLSISNQGKSVATQISYAVFKVPETGAGFNRFIHPRQLGLEPFQKAAIGGALPEGANFLGEFVLVGNTGDLFLLLVHCIDLNNSICQTQCQFLFQPDAFKSILGFAELTYEQRLELAGTLENPHDPEECGITAW